MQQIQQALDIAALIPIATAALLLLLHLLNCWHRTPTSRQPVRAIAFNPNTIPGELAVPDPAQLTEEVLEACQAEPELYGHPGERQVLTVTDPNKLNCQQLRKECSKLGISWRNVKGAGKHLTKPEMLNAIGLAIS